MLCICLVSQSLRWSVARYENALAATVTLQREARRAALLEAVQMIEDDCYGVSIISAMPTQHFHSLTK